MKTQDIKTKKIEVENGFVEVRSTVRFTAAKRVDPKAGGAVEGAERETREMVVRGIYQSVRDDARAAYEELRHCAPIYDPKFAETLRRVMEPLLTAGDSAV